MEAIVRPHQQLGTVGVDTGTRVLVADGHLPTARQWLSQVHMFLCGFALTPGTHLVVREQ